MRMISSAASTLMNAPSRSTLPPRTSFVDASKPDVAAAELDDSALALSRIHGWLSISAPPGDASFPWRFELVDTTTKQPATSLVECSRTRW